MSKKDKNSQFDVICICGQDNDRKRRCATHYNVTSEVVLSVLICFDSTFSMYVTTVPIRMLLGL